MNITGTTSLRELAFIVCTALHRHGTTAVLSGGGAATIYAPNVYQSRDLDFILAYGITFGNPSAAPLIELGFVERGGTYVHDKTPFTVEFPIGPLAIGDQLVTQWDTLREHDKLLNILSPTDCVRDRLAWFLFYNDFSSLNQAIGVALNQSVDLDIIEEWCQTEGKPEKFLAFKRKLSSENPLVTE